MWGWFWRQDWLTLPSLRFLLICNSSLPLQMYLGVCPCPSQTSQQDDLQQYWPTHSHTGFSILYSWQRWHAPLDCLWYFEVICGSSIQLKSQCNMLLFITWICPTRPKEPSGPNPKYIWTSFQSHLIWTLHYCFAAITSQNIWDEVICYCVCGSHNYLWGFAWSNSIKLSCDKSLRS